MAEHPSQTACRRMVLSPVKSRGNKSFPRLEIDTFCQVEKRLNLYLLALHDLQHNDDLQDIWSYFQISAIHGRPAIDYNGCTAYSLYQFLKDENRKDEMPVPGKGEGPAERGDISLGFCVHGSVLFPSWHRAYILVIEQALQAKMHEIAGKFPRGKLRDTYMTLADRFRHPYWDPFHPRRYNTADNTAYFGISWIFCVKNLRVKFPDAPTTWKTIENPLYQYIYPEVSRIAVTLPDVATSFLTSMSIGAARNLPNTCRNSLRRKVEGDGNEVFHGKSNHVQLQRTLLIMSDPNHEFRSADDKANPFDPEAPFKIENFRSAGMRAKLYACLTQTKDPDLANPGFAYGRFATRSFGIAHTPFTDHGREPRSIEAYHDELHNAIAGRGDFWGTFVSNVKSWYRYGRANLYHKDPPNMSSWDPMFWSFHTGIDMHYSLFLAANPTLRFTKADGLRLVQGDRAHRVRTIDTPTTPLMPFRKEGENVYKRFFGWERKTTPKYINTEDVLEESKWGFHYDVLGEHSSPEAAQIAAITYINKYYGWLNPTTDHMTDKFVAQEPFENKNRSIVRSSIVSMKAVSAFVPNPANLAPWPPLIDDRTDVIEIHPPPAVSVDPDPFAPPAPPAHASIMALHTPSAMEAMPPTSHSLMSPEVANASATESLADLRNGASIHPEHVSTEALGPGEVAEKRNPKFTYDPPHPKELYYNLPNHIVKNGREMQNWSFQARYERFALNCGFTIYVFVGDFPADFAQWSTCQNFVLGAHNFANPDHSRMNPNYSGQGDNPNLGHSNTNGSESLATTCGNCAKQAEAGALVADWVPLTPILLDYVLSGRRASTLVPEAEATLSSLDQADVVPFLKRHLHWRILRGDGVEIHRTDVAQFVAWVHDEVMLLPRTWDELPEYRDHVIQWDITHGRPGGLDNGDWP